MLFLSLFNTFKTWLQNKPLALVTMFLIIIPTIRALSNRCPLRPDPRVARNKWQNWQKSKPAKKLMTLGGGDGEDLFSSRQIKLRQEQSELSFLLSVFQRALIKKMIWKSKGKIKFGNFRNTNPSRCRRNFRLIRLLKQSNPLKRNFQNN